MIGIKSDKTTSPLIMIMAKLGGYVKVFKVEDKINKLMSFRIDEEHY